MAHCSLANISFFFFAAFCSLPRVFCAPHEVLDPEGVSSGHQPTSQQNRAAELLNEFAGENDVAVLMAEYTNAPVPYVLVGEDRDDCPRGDRAQAARAVPSHGFLNHSLGVGASPVVSIDANGRSSGPCPKVFLQEAPYYGRREAVKALETTLQTTLGDLTQSVDMTRLGLDRDFNEKAYESLRVCNNFFFSGSGNTRSSSDPACVVSQLDDAAVNIKALDAESLSVLHPRLKTALVIASNLAFTRHKKEWIRKLITSSSLRLAWHVVEAFAGMNVNMLEANVGEALNSIVVKDLKLLLPLKDLIQFATTCTTYEEYPEKSWQDAVRNPSPDSPDYKDYPIYDYLRKVGAEVAFPVNIPSDWKPRVYDGNRMTHRGAGERKPFNSPADWKKRVYDSWHNLWILHLVTMDTGSMWQWSHHLNASTFFFKPWKVTRVGTVQVAEADLDFFDKLKAPKGQLSAQWGRMDFWRSLGVLGWNCPVSEASVPCPPKVHEDRCGIDATYLRPVESPWLFRLEREPEWVTWEIDEKNNDYVDKIWMWLLNTMWETTVDPELSRSGEGKVHSGFLFAFKHIFKAMLEDDLREVKEKSKATGKRQVLLFTGHSLGGAVAQIAAWYLANKARSLLDAGLLQVRCVTFGAPAWGNEMAYKEFMNTGVLIHDIATSMDPVTTLNGEPALGHGLQWRKPFHYRIMLDDFDEVVVASKNPTEPNFFGRLWTRTDLHAGNFLKRTFGALASMNHVDSVFLNPVLTHFLSYTAVLTIMADLVPEADFGSALAAPLLNDPPSSYASHTLCTALIATQGRMKWVMNQLALETSRARKPPLHAH
ncbi:lipase domain-containing protein, putative [Eimeria maxima]|uniref:Lipase domain-containing protein, putative n=1 Tax=Eimeria maxima TaxID=5804 RepID=U6M798_EIMMA|nr:lipase domain-containing protein, putative [Eimeria maxima]CDJ60067.1 lipase domain-containing protein, putative [Eimeria maxima]